MNQGLKFTHAADVYSTKYITNNFNKRRPATNVVKNCTDVTCHDPDTQTNGVIQTNNHQRAELFLFVFNQR